MGRAAKNVMLVFNYLESNPIIEIRKTSEALSCIKDCHKSITGNSKKSHSETVSGRNIKKQRRRTGLPRTLTLLKLHFLFIKQRRGEISLRRIREDCDNCFAFSQLLRQLQGRRHIGSGGYAAHDSFFRGQLL